MPENPKPGSGDDQNDDPNRRPQPAQPNEPRQPGQSPQQPNPTPPQR
jgi:hypothetical protein